MGRDILILRDPRESVKRCSLTPLRGMAGVRFVSYHRERRLAAEGRVLLHTDGELLSSADEGAGLLLIDCSWRRVPALLSTLEPPFVLRRLPALRTAYPRKSSTFEDPSQGLASIEALYAAQFYLAGGGDPELLAQYHWADEFLEANPSLG